MEQFSGQFETSPIRSYRRIEVPSAFQTERGGVRFGGDLRIGDLDGDGRCELLVYRCRDGFSEGAHAGGMKPCFLGAFDLDGNALWQQGEGGEQPARPMSVALHDFDGDGAAEVACFWHRPGTGAWAGPDSLADVALQIRDGRTGAVLREAVPEAIIARRRKDPQGANWVHQRLMIANLRGLDRPRDLVVKLGDTYVALDDALNVLWTHQTPWIRYANCPAYVPAVGDIDGDGRDEVFTGYALLGGDGALRWQDKVARNMDSVAIKPWDNGRIRAIGSGGGHVLDAAGEVILRLGESIVPHGQEVRVANFLPDHSGPDMVVRYNGHKPHVRVISSDTGEVVRDMELNDSPTNVGMEPVFWRGPLEPALLYNGGRLWDLATGGSDPLPELPPPNGTDVHRMAFHHAIAADICGDEREELVVWDPTAAEVFVYTPVPLDGTAYGGYAPGPRQYNPRLMD